MSDRTPNTTDTSDTKMALEVRDISKAFGGLQVISDLRFSVPLGRSTALIGPNGAGKSTVFNLISGVYPLDKGSIHVNGTDVTHVPSRHRIRFGVSRSFQNIRLMPHLTVLENLLLGQHAGLRALRELFIPYGFQPRHPWKQQALEALESHDMAQYAQRRIDELAYGIRKRVDLVRATLANPSVLLLDEPAAGLNASESVDLLKHLHRLQASGMTLVVVEHDMQFVKELRDYVVVLNFGKKIAEGLLQEVSALPAVREAYLGTQG